MKSSETCLQIIHVFTYKLTPPQKLYVYMFCQPVVCGTCRVQVPINLK